MWTPKRILLLASALVVFVGFFGVYAWFLGGIDGLPQLPPSYLPDDNAVEPLANKITIGKPEVDRKLEMAYGIGCPQTRRTIKVEVAKKGMVFATEDFEILEDGRVRFQPFSIALFRKTQKPGDYPEINTIHSKQAFLTFDRPIVRMSDMGDRKIVGAELRGEIHIVNNRRTSQRHDDVDVLITGQPLIYSEPKKKIWSDGIVRLTDTQPKPEPTLISARGLEIHLDKNSSLTGDKTSPAASRNNSVSAVQKIVLRENVKMRLHIDSKSAFLTPGPKQAKTKPDQDPRSKPTSEKSVVNISTAGRFFYNLIDDRAVFESLVKTGPQIAAYPNDHVMVERIHDKDRKKKNVAEIRDQVLCDRLILQFRRKEGMKQQLRNSQTGGREIASATATARPGRTVRFASDSENLEARGVEMIYRGATKDRGAVTIIRGETGSLMWAVKDAHKITARTLELIAANAKGKGQHVFAQGPVRIDLVDPNDKKKEKTPRYHAYCSESLTVTKDREGEKELDLLTFQGKAGFLDEAGEQELAADKLQLWLEPAERTRSAADLKQDTDRKAPGAPRQQPHKLEGFGAVRVQSPKLNVKKCQHLLVRFENATAEQLPDATPVARAETAPQDNHVAHRNGNQTRVVVLPPSRRNEPAPVTKTSGIPSLPQIPASTKTSGDELPAPKAAANADQKPPAKPIDLQARQVSVYLVRHGKKTDLKEALAEGDVFIEQEGKTPEDKGVKITGARLDLVNEAGGNILVVRGDTKQKKAELRLGQLVLIGPKVTIDQPRNETLVKGAGAMTMPSKTTFEGTKAKPNTLLVVHWNEEMRFNGKDAAFFGGVSARQNDATLRCSGLHVTLDRKVSLKEGEKQGKGAKVERLVCSDKVDIWEIKKLETGAWLRFDRMIAAELTVDNKYGPINAAGPGRIYLWQQGTMDPTNLNPQAAKKKTTQFFMTRIDYSDRLFSTKYPDGSRIANFSNSVEVFHLPANHPNVPISLAKLPKGAMHMTCRRLQLKTIPIPGKKSSSQVMVAKGTVKFHTDEYHVFAEQAIYDQRSEKVIFIGTNNPAELYRQTPGTVAQERSVLRGGRIYYNRRTGAFSLTEGRSISGGQ